MKTTLKREPAKITADDAEVGNLYYSDHYGVLMRINSTNRYNDGGCSNYNRFAIIDPRATPYITGGQLILGDSKPLTPVKQVGELELEVG